MKNILINVGFAILCFITVITVIFIIEFLFTHYAMITTEVVIFGVLFMMCYMFVSVIRDK